MATLHQCVDDIAPAVGTTPIPTRRFRLRSAVLDLFWACLGVLVVPNLLTFFLFGASPEFFRGWINVELALVFAAAVAFRNSRIALAAMAIEIVADLLEPVAHVFYFGSSDAVAALQFLKLLPNLRLLGYALALTAYVAATLFALTLVRRQIKQRRFSALMLCAIVLAASLVDVVSGRYMVFHTDIRTSHALLVRTPAISILSKLRKQTQASHEPRHIETPLGTLLRSHDPIITARKANVVTVLVESWGLVKDEQLREFLSAPLTSAALASRYTIESGTMPFVGNTIYGESRTLCGEIFDTELKSVSASRLGQCYPAQLEHLGYSTLFVHGFNPRMYNRDHWLPKIGFREFLSEPQLRNMGMRTCPGGLVGICDGDISDFLHRRMLRPADAAPQYIHWTSLDSHLPIEVTPERLHQANCGQSSRANDGAVCVWSSLVRNVTSSIAQIALDKSLAPTVFVVAGDHAPPFYSASRRAEFSQDRVPYVVLIPH